VKTALLLSSPLLNDLGVPHCFSTRIGGHSAGMFSSLNFGNPGDLEEDQRDTRATIWRNFDLVHATLHTTGREVVQVHQVHGPSVHQVRPGQPSHRPHATETGDTTRADAIVTNDPLRLIAVRVADCAPILLSDPTGTYVAAVHAGWKGLIAGVLENTIHRLTDSGVSASSLTAAIGPCISGEAFEVGAEVLEAFTLRFPSYTAEIIRHTHPGKGYVDLPAALRCILRDSGVSRIDTLGRCTVQEPEYFFSHRRDRGRTGRMIAAIGPRCTSL
jgi:YfiH family protein